MFVAQSAVKIWRVRSAFFLLCVVPTMCLSYWAVICQSKAHREHIAENASKLLGSRVRIESLTHPQPGCLKLSGVTIAEQSFDDVFVVTSKDEVRVTVDSLVSGEDTARLIVGLVKRWLAEPVQFNKNCVIDIEDFSWGKINPEGVGNISPLRIECVSTGSGRAIRFFQRDNGQDEVRIVRTPHDGKTEGHATGYITEFEVNVSDPVPVPFVNVALGECGASQWPFGENATFTGHAHISNRDGAWTAECVGGIKQVDLDAMTLLLPSHMQGDAEIKLNRFVWSDQRIALCDCVCVADQGEIEQVWIDRLVTILGCRVEDAYHQLSGSRVRSFERLGFGLVVDSKGLHLSALPGRSGCLLESRGSPVILEPTQTATLDRVAWLLSGTTPAAVPETDVTGWLLSVLPRTGVLQ